MRRAPASAQLGRVALLMLCLVLRTAEPSRANETDAIQRIVETFAGAAIQQGVAPGIGVGVVDNGRSHTFVFGYADPVNKIPFARDSIFEIGSVTKVFTTNLLGQAVFEKRLKLDDRLAQFSRQLGVFDGLTGQITLEELGDFTAGFPQYAPLCSDQPVPGCLPSSRPPISQYSAQDFVDFFRNTVPMNYQTTPPTPVTSLPAPYLYSDFSIGLLGLLLGTPPGRAVSDNSLDVWLNEVHSRILQPLSMTSTYLFVPVKVPATRIANGYSLALASAQVAAGQISAITVLDGGAAYAGPPIVTISGGGGSGAAASANIDRGSVLSIDVTAAGSGYVAPPEATVSGGNPTTNASLLPIVADGHVKAVEVLSGGDGYQSVPTVTIAGGLRPGGRNAVASARLANGRVVSIIITDGGAGYLPPLTVALSPGDPESSIVPIWAPAGALLSTVDDLTRFAAAALGSSRKAGRSGLPIPLAAGFKIAETVYACTGENPDLSTCPAGEDRSGLAWGIHPADAANGVPEIVNKDGGVSGFSTQVLLVQGRQLAVVVLVNSRAPGDDTGSDGAGYPLARYPAETIASNIGYALLDVLPQ